MTQVLQSITLCTILLYAEGYRAARTLRHYRTIQALLLILDPEQRADADYLDSCRKKRNIVEYDYAGGATDDEASELAAYVLELCVKVLNRLKEDHLQLLNPH